MRIALGNDHRGFVLKEQLEVLIDELGHEWIHFGAFDEHPVDYPDVAYEAALAVATAEADRAILVCAIGMGMCIAANKVDGIRATVCCDEMTARLSRTHNDANVLCLGADFLGVDVLRKIIEVWLSTDFTGGRHERRVAKVAAIEEGKDPRDVTTRSDHVVAGVHAVTRDLAEHKASQVP